MEKRKRVLFNSYGPVKLYLDEIRKIIQTLEEIPDNPVEGLTDNPKTRILTDEYEFDSLDNLLSIENPEYDYFDIECETRNYHVPLITVKVRKNKTDLIAYYDSILLTGVFSKIDGIISHRQRPWRWIKELYPFIIALTLFNLTFIILGFVIKNSTLSTIGYGLAALSWILLLLAFVTTKASSSIVIIKNKDSLPTFWERNRDTIIVAVITAVITAILTIIGTIFIQSLSK